MLHSLRKGPHFSCPARGKRGGRNYRQSFGLGRGSVPRTRGSAIGAVIVYYENVERTWIVLLQQRQYGLSDYIGLIARRHDHRNPRSSGQGHMDWTLGRR